VEARAATERLGLGRAPVWALALIPLALIAGAVGAFVLLDAPGLGDRRGVPVEDLAVEHTVLHPGELQLTLRNDGPDPVDGAQVNVNDAFVPFAASGEGRVGRLGTSTLTVPYEWVEGEAYEVTLLTSTGGTVATEIASATESPEADAGFYGLMALLGLYVGVIPIGLGMLWLPFVRRVGEAWIRALIAFTVGLLAFLAIDATVEGLEIAGDGPAAFGGPVLVFLGILVAYLVLAGVEAYLSDRRRRAEQAAPPAAVPGGASATGAYLALLVAVGIGLHNLGEGLAIGSAYSAGALALGAFLVVGFALHNTTEGLAIVAPLAQQTPRVSRLAVLGLIAGAPAIVGAWIGAAAFNPSIGAFLFGIGAGAIVQVIRQLWPGLRDAGTRSLSPGAVPALLSGSAVMYATSLLVSV
jgi:zinc transporter, ZIP family